MQSTHREEITEEIYSEHVFEEELRDLAFCPKLRRAAVVGDSSIKIIENQGSKWGQVVAEEVNFNELRDGIVEKVAWTGDGQILTASTQSGRVYNYVAAMPVVHSSHGCVNLSCATLVCIISIADF